MIFFYEGGDDNEDYLEFFNRLKKYPNENKFNTTREAMEAIRNSKIVAHVSEKALRQYFKEYPDTVVPATFSSGGERLRETMIVTKNSPLGSMLTFGCSLLIERGYVDILDEKWFGKGILPNFQSGNLAAHVLSLGELMLGLVLICSATVLSLIILMMELVLFLKKK